MNMEETAHSHQPHRRSGERRQARLLSFFYGFYRAQRAGDRRNVRVAQPSYVDIHDAFTYALVLMIMLFCVADAYLTLLLIEHGARELNPILAWALEKDALLFYGTKYSLTTISVVLLIQHKHFMFFGIRAFNLLIGVLLAYAALITYQLSMLRHLI